MTIHVNIGEAKTRLSQLIAAAERGEEVIIARDGRAVAKLEPIESNQEIVARRGAAFGMWKGLVDQETIDRICAPLSEQELAEWYNSSLFPPDDDAERSPA